MRKASGTVIYDGKTKQIYYFAINYKGTLIPMINYSIEKIAKPYKYKTLNDMYKSLLNIAKNNDFYFSSFKSFGRVFYDIQWIDKTSPETIDKFGYMTEENKN